MKELLPSISDLEPGEWRCVQTDYVADTSVLENPTFGKATVRGAFWTGGLFDTRSRERHGVLCLWFGVGEPGGFHREEATNTARAILRDGVMLGFEGQYELRMSLVPRTEGDEG